MADSWLNTISTGLDNGEVFKRWNYVNRRKCCLWGALGRAPVLSLNSVQAWQVYSLLNFDFFYLENRLHHVVPSSLPTVPWSFFLFSFFYGSIVNLKNFRYTAKWFSYIYTNIYTHTYIHVFFQILLYIK